MYGQQNPQQLNTPSPVEQVRIVSFLFTFLMQAWSASIYPFTRRDFGVAFFGLTAWAGLPLSWVLGITFAPGNVVPFQLFTYAFIAVVLIQRIKSVRIAQQRPIHSLYSGRPVICDWFGVEELAAKRYWEPLTVMMAGALCLLLHPGFGWFLIGGGMAMSADTEMAKSQMERRVRRILDSEIENGVLQTMVEQRRRGRS